MRASTTERVISPWLARGLVSVLDFAAGGHRRAAAILTLICLVAFLPGFFQIPPIDRDEPRFAQASKQMVQSGDFVDIRFQQEVRYKKPVGIYWLQAAAVKVATAAGLPDASTRIWIYRIPSLVGATGAVLLTYWAALAFVSRRAAFLAALMLASSILLGVEARLAKTDAALLAAIVAALGAMARAYLGEIRKPGGARRAWLAPAVFWTALAAGILLKGPVIVMIAGLTAATLVVLDRSARWLLALRPLPGLLWLLVLVSPWFVAILLRSGSVFFSESVGQDMVQKVVSGQESHGAPPGYYLLLFFATFWPGSLLAGLAAPHVFAARREAPARFLLAWLVPSWIVFELVLTKLPHYVLPLYPAIAILIAGCIDFHRLSQARWLVRGTLWWFLAPVIVGLAGVWAVIGLTGGLGLLAWPLAAMAVIFGYRAWWLYEADGAERALLRAAASSIFVAYAIYGVVMPSLTPLFPGVQVAHTLQQAKCANPSAAMAHYHEPSVVFLTGTGTVLTDATGAADFLLRGSCRFAFVDARHERSFAQRAEAIGLRYERGPRIDGMNISNGRPITLAVFHTGEHP
jgi:4-amino-4-deoxy-L-arabinose transferase-like glycosyltransferase